MHQSRNTLVECRIVSKMLKFAGILPTAVSPKGKKASLSAAHLIGSRQLGTVLVLAMVLSLTACKEEDKSNASGLQDIEAKCREGANRMFPESEADRIAKIDRCLSEHDVSN